MDDFSFAPASSPPSPPPHQYGSDNENENQGPPTPARRAGTRPKKMPTVTPRRFNRFFAPRSSQPDQFPQSSPPTRMPLGEVSASQVNRLPQSSPIRKSKRLLDQGEDGYSLASTPEKASPLKRVCLTQPNDRPSYRPNFLFSQDIPSSPPPYDDTPQVKPPAPLRKSRFRTSYACVSAREMGIASISSAVGAASDGVKVAAINTRWESETSNFYSRISDIHHTYSCLENQGWKKAVPFSIASCHQESIIAVSDEEGFIRLIDSEKDSKNTFDTAMVEMLAHKNAILDLEFSEDDMRLGTASGDRTALVIDVQRQETLYTMFAHKASLRQVRFQPGSGGNVLATAGRDGMIAIWDLRCKPETLSIPAGRGRRNLEPDSRKYAQWIHSFMPPVLVPKDAGRRYTNADSAEKSVTAMSFLSADQPSLIMSGSATSAGICLWDLRQMRTKQMSCSNALVNTAFPNCDNKSTRGVVGMTLSGDRSRAYALCKDSTVYTYSTSEMLCKDASVDALYGFRNPALQVTSFYCGVDIRPATDAKSELLAVCGGSGGPVVIPTDESYLGQHGGVIHSTEDRNGVKIYKHGSVLRHGHNQEICDVGFTNQGNLISVGDDSRVRVWYEDADVASGMRRKAKNAGEDTRGHAYSESASAPQDSDYDTEMEDY